MSILNPCSICACKEFVAHPWKDDKCINCYHQHRPPRPDSQSKRGPTNSNNASSNPQPTSMYSRSTWRRPDTVQIKIMASSDPASQSFDHLNRQVLISAERGKHERVSKVSSEQSPTSTKPLPPIPSKLRGGTTPSPMKSASSPALLQPEQNRNTVHMGINISKATSENGETSPKPSKKLTNTEYRHKIITEMLETEKYYVKQLSDLINCYFLPLKKEPRTGKNVEEIFNNIEQVLQINGVLLKSLEERVQHWDPETTIISSVFLEVGPYLKPYYKTYTEGYASAQSVLTECEKSSDFADFLQQTQEQLNGMTIRSFLITPIQRIPRYLLLLAELLKHTEQTHVDYGGLVACLDKMKSIANDINQAIKQGENRQKILHIQDSFLNESKLGQTLVEPHRVYIRDGPLQKVCRKNIQPRWFFLFNDLLIHASLAETAQLISLNRYVVHQVYQLSDIRTEDIADSETTKYAFMIVTGKKSFVVIAGTQVEKFDWMIDICQAIEEVQAKKATFAKSSDTTQPQEYKFEAPVWQQDSEVQNCPLCETEFGLIQRKSKGGWFECSLGLDQFFEICGVCDGSGNETCVCQCIEDDLLGYDLSALDMLIYRAEIDWHVRPAMHDVMETLKDQLMEMLFSDVDFGNRLEIYETFRQCALDAWDQLKYRFNL